jgi:acetyl esterase/lipase
MYQRFSLTMGLGLSLLIAQSLLAQQPKARTKAQGPSLPEGVKVERDLAYGPHKERNNLDLYLPPEGKAPRPLVIWIHGGAWLGGSKDGGPRPAEQLLRRGYAVASINYRLSQHAPFPAQIDDCKAAVRFLRANASKYDLDPDHFGVWGGSAGGHLVALLGTSGDVKDLEGEGSNKGVSSRVQAVCDFFGPADLLTMAPQSGPDSTIQHDAPNSPESLLLGGPILERKDAARRASPVTYITKDDPPFLIVHGDKDNTVPVGQSKELHEALKKAGVDSTLMIIPGAGHGNGILTPETLRAVADFFDKHLKNGAARLRRS